jgi:hypothetical protein
MHLVEVSTSGPDTWPKAAADGENLLVFNLPWLGASLEKYLARVEFYLYFKSLAKLAAFLAVTSLGLHLFAPLQNFWLAVATGSFLFTLIFWSYKLWRFEPSLDPDKVEVERHFEPETLIVILGALKSAKNPSHLQILLRLTADKQTRNILYRTGIGYRDLNNYLADRMAYASDQGEQFQALQPLPFAAFRLRERLRFKKVNNGVLLAALWASDHDTIKRVREDFLVSSADIETVVRWEGYLRQAPMKQIAGKYKKLPLDVYTYLVALMLEKRYPVFWTIPALHEIEVRAAESDRPKFFIRRKMREVTRRLAGRGERRAIGEQDVRRILNPA